MDTKEKILIVDDEQENLDIYSKIFISNGYEVETAKNSEDTFKKLKIYKPDLILLDVVLKPESGIDVLKELKSKDEYKNIYVVLISGVKDKSEEMAFGLEQGADGYLSRTIDRRELIARVKAFMKHKRTMDELIKSEARFRKIIEKNPDAILIVDKDGEIKFANPAAEGMFRLTMGELMSRVFGFPIVVGEHTEISIVRRDEGENYGEMRTIDIDWDDMDTFLTSIRDITDRKNAELSLAKKAEELAKMNSFMVNREMKMLELKKEINELLQKLKKPKKYNAPDDAQK